MKPQTLGIGVVIILAVILIRTYSPSPKSSSDINKKSQLVSTQSAAQASGMGRKAVNLAQMEKAGSAGKSLVVSGKTQSAWESFVSKAIQLFTGGSGGTQSGSSSTSQLTVASAGTSSGSKGGSSTTSSSASTGTSSGSTGTGSSSGTSTSSGSSDTSSSGGSSSGTSTSSGSSGTSSSSGSSSGTGSGSSSGGSSGSGTQTSTTGDTTQLVGMPDIEGKSDAELQALGLYVMENDVLQYIYDKVHSRIIAYDKRAARQWWAPVSLSNISVRVEKRSRYLIRLELTERTSTRAWIVDIAMEESAAEVLYEIKAPKDMAMGGLIFPPVFVVDDSAEIIAPLAEGLKLPIDAYHQDFPEALFYAGSRPMPLLGILEGNVGWMQILETPNDVGWGGHYVYGGKIVLFNQWQSEKGLFGYDRRIRFCFFDQGGYVAMAKRFREFAISKGWLVSLETKNIANGNIDKLIGAMNVWYFGTNRLALAIEMKERGLSNVIFSMPDRLSRGDIVAINNLGFLTSLYDNYRDTWPPGVSGVFSNEGWPDDLVLDRAGQPLSGWVVTRNGVNYTGGQVCSIPALTRAKQRINVDLVNFPYTARFIDTTTAVIRHECFNPTHPTTKSLDGEYRIKLLGFVSEDKQIVTSSEDGIADAVPVVDYLEGMMSIHVGRLPGSGNHVFSVSYMTPTDLFLRYQVGEKYRIPLWELIFHDAVVTTWYWDDSTNRIPEVWWRRDLLNILYGNMPLWGIRDHAHWQQYETAFIASYKNVSPVLEKVGYKEMLTHAFLTDDHTVQETTFTGNIRIVVNFSYVDYRLTPAVTVKAHGFVVLENGIVWKTGVCDYAAAVAPNGGG